MSPRSWGYPLYQEGKNHVVGSSCVMRKIFPYRNMCGDHTRACRIRRYAYPSVDVIRPLSMGHVSIGSVRVRLLSHQERASSHRYYLTFSFCWCRVRGSKQTSLEIDGSFRDQCRWLIIGVAYSLLTSSIVENFFSYFEKYPHQFQKSIIKVLHGQKSIIIYGIFLFSRMSSSS